MSALPLPDNVFKLPKRRPKIVEKAAPPDQRSLAVVPLRAIRDRNISDSQLRCLATICSYCNRAGLTWVGQDRIGKDLGVSKQSINKQVRRLVELGYLEVVSKGFRGERANTMRVIFDPEIKTEDAIAVTSSIEDTRPPEIRRQEAKAMTTPEPEQDFTEEQMAANRQRLKQLLGGLAGRDGNHHFNKPERLGDIMATRKPRAKKAPHNQPNTVDNDTAFHSQLHSQPNEVDRTQKNIGIHEVLSLYEEIIKRRFMVSVKTTEDCLKVTEVLCEVGVTASEIDAALTEPLSMVEVAQKILDAKVNR